MSTTCTPKTAPARKMRYSSYSEYKDSGVEWVGKVPKHWEMKRLKISAQLTDKKVEANEANPLLYIGLENIESRTGKLLPLDSEVIPSGVTNKFSKKNTLFGKLRPYLAKAYNPDFDGLCSTELLVMESKDFERRALLYWLLADGFIKLVDSSTYGSKMPRANWGFIGDCLLPVPPLVEQTTIADFLDQETERIDTLVAKKRRLIALLKEKRTALISRTVTRGLPEAAAREFGLEPHTCFKDSGIEWLGEVPIRWKIGRLKDVGILVAGSAFPQDAQGIEDEQLPFYKVADLTISTDGRKMLRGEHSISKHTAYELRAKVIPPFSIIYAKIGAALLLNRRRITTVPCCIDNNMTAYIPSKHQVISLFAFYWLSILDLGEFTNPGAVPSISEGYQSTLPIIVPRVTEQTAIATYLDRETTKIDQLIEKIATAIERLQEYRTALITAAVTGKIKVA